jgi:hypothetical protein
MNAASSRPLSSVPGSSTELFGLLGDQPTVATATNLRYTASGLEYMGEPLRTRGMLYPLLWSNYSSTLSSSGSSGDGLVFTPAPGELQPKESATHQ